MKKILVPVDFSAHTDTCCRYAIEFARVYEGEIKLFHTYFDQIILADTSFPDTLDMSTIYNEELMKEIFKQAEINMNELEQKVRQMLKKENLEQVKLSTLVAGGEIEHELMEICKSYHPDLVVLGTTGKGNNVNVWGKVSTYIIDHAKVPVLTVPVLKSYKGFSSLMFAADLTDGNADVIQKLCTLFKPFNFKLHVVHFLVKHTQTDAYVKMKALQLKFGKEEKSGMITFRVIEGSKDNQKDIDDFISANDINLIAFHPHKRSLFYMMFTRNITKKNLFATNIPLLAIPESDQLQKPHQQTAATS